MTRLVRRTLPATIPGLPGYLHCTVAVAVVGVLCGWVIAGTPGGGS